MHTRSCLLPFDPVIGAPICLAKMRSWVRLTYWTHHLPFDPSACFVLAKNAFQEFSTYSRLVLAGGRCDIMFEKI